METPFVLWWQMANSIPITSDRISKWYENYIRYNGNMVIDASCNFTNDIAAALDEWEM